MFEAPLQETEEKILAHLVILSYGCRPVAPSEIAEKIVENRWTVRNNLIKLVRRGLARRADSSYIANLDNYVIYLLKIYGDMNFRELVSKTINFLPRRPSGSRLQRFRRKLRETLQELLSRYEITINSTGAYSISTIGHIVARVLKNMDTKCRMDYSGGMIIAEVLCQNAFFIYAYEGITREDIDYILEINADRVLKMKSDRLIRYLDKILWRVLRLLSVMLNEKIGLLNILALIKDIEKKILVIIRGDDLMAIEPELIYHANRRINMLLKIIEKAWREKYRDQQILWPTIVIDHHYALENALIRINEALKSMKKRQNIKLSFTRAKNEVQSIIEDIIKQWC